MFKIAHPVICLYCSNKFDRDKEDHVQVGRRYAHASCAQRKAENSGTEMPRVIKSGSTVVCHFCKKAFDKSIVPFVELSATRFAHQTCALREATRERTDEEKLYDYVMDLFHMDYVPPLVRKQVNEFMEEYKYTYSGIHKALVYFHKIQGNPIQLEKGIAIVPFIYQDAYNYYYAIWEANNRNARKNIADYVPKVREVHILPPERQVEKRKLFSFLDDDEVEV